MIMPKEVMRRIAITVDPKENFLDQKTDFFFQKMTCEFLRIINSLCQKK